MENATSYRLWDESNIDDFEAQLAEQRSFLYDSSYALQWRYFDTFDWRLYERGLTLRRSDDLLMLSSSDGNRATCIELGSEKPVFSWDLPQGALRDRLSSTIKARALLELVHVGLTITSYRILNDHDKTVARVSYVSADVIIDVHQTANNVKTLPVNYVSLRPVRGYSGHARRLRKALNLGKAVGSLEQAILVDALAADDRVPNSYSAKLDFQLDPRQRSDDAAKIIHRRLLETIRANESGIIEDIDIEFLHDYRVAIRRTRSALSQIPGVFPAATTAHFKQAFRKLGKQTNLLRDLDVYLLAEPAYRAMLPENIQQDITPLFEMLHADRMVALQAVQEGLNNQGYESILTEWDKFLQEPGANAKDAPNAGLPIIELARRQIDKRYRRIVKDGTYILDHTEDELLHALRLECKKLRYLLEFFASLFPHKKITRLIKQLKILQENLGDFTDLAVQQDALMAMADQLPDDDPRTRRALIATGALVETLARRQLAVKAEFSEKFTQFASTENQNAFAELFTSKKKRKSKKRKGKAK